MKSKGKGAPPAVQEAVKVLLDHGIGAHEFASLAGVAYSIPKEVGPVLLGTKAASKRWGISRWTIYKWVREGRLDPITGTKEWLFKPEDIEGALRRL